MREFYLKNKPLIILWLFCLIALIVFTGHYSNILLDVGREVYYPERILEGKVLYKDLFNIYGPFSYLWNAFLYKIFGINLSTLYLSGAVCSIGIVSGIYLIARKFLDESMSFAITFFTIATGVCASHLFNFTFPYSWAMLYGIVGFIYSVYFLIKYKQTDLSKYLYLSGLLAGFAVANKYEFVIYAGFLFVVSLFSKNKMYILNVLTSLLVFPVLSFGILFIQGLRIEDLITACQEISKMMNAKTLEYFYKSQGVLFTPKAFPVWGINILKTGIPFTLMLLSYRLFEKNKCLSIILMAVFAITGYLLSSPAVFVFLIPLLILISLIQFKELKENIPLLFLVVSAVTVSLKSFWGLIPLNYGNFYISIVLAAFFAVLFTLINKKYQQISAIFLIVISLSFLFGYIYNRTILTGKIASPQGVIYTFKPQAEAANKVLSFLNNDNNAKTAVVYPEGLILNFLSKNRLKSDDYYNSLIPLYFESMGEDKFLNQLIEKRPDFVVLNNQNMSDYYFKNICTDYAQYFCYAVLREYVPLKEINSRIQYSIYRLNK